LKTNENLERERVY